MPPHVPLAGQPCGLGWGQHADAHVRPAVVVEVDGAGHGGPHLGDAGESLAQEQLVLNRVVYALGLGVVLRVARLGHADAQAAPGERPHVLAARVLAAAV